PASTHTCTLSLHDALPISAIFPEALAKDHIISWSNKGDVVFDPFMGSGTTAVAALDVGREYIGAEIAKEYVEIANERIKNHTTQDRKSTRLNSSHVSISYA